MTYQSDNVGASRWMDRNDVKIMYTGYDPSEKSTVERRKKDGSRAPVPCPIAFVEYNKYMGAVDRGDQLRAYYATKIKSWKFYKYIVNFLLGVTVVNAYIIYMATHPTSRLTIKKFIQVLVSQLIAVESAGRVSRQIQPLPLCHFPTKTPSSNSERKRGRCSLCQEK